MTQHATQHSVSRLLLFIYVGLVLFFLILPVLIVFPISFSSSRFLSFPPPGYSLRWYIAFFDSSAWMSAGRTSLIVAVATTLIATPLGVSAAYAMDNSSSSIVRYLKVVLLLPMIIPIIIIAIGVFFVYARTGLLASIPGLILADVMLGIPYVVTAVTAGLQGFDKAQEMAARSLGMNRFRSFLAVTLPQIWPSVITGAIFAFIQSLDETIVALFISGGQYQTLTKRMFTSLRDEIDPTIAAISTVLTVTSFALVLLMLLSRKKSDR
ncbi:ABC transporter permease [Paralcaligenes ureilyticus]|uniref:Putative spermidine/putrescine transport system permease protein n=1 Tax=Paralcaligenes ureilyticus TaxID=627131 RepID=A0A4R3MDA3_9BURK|nr:ABC transporter permease [Paralcaligenes ureilyticus]TCT11112.1 putative spermidine/putrescine transport system permease protein [Paralcaligenes ureilyticus]